MTAPSPRVAPVTSALQAALAGGVEAATVALVRYDERLVRVEPVLAEGAGTRAHLLEAQALIHLSGGVAPLEDIVLNDAGMDARLPSPEVVRAVGLARLRRRLRRRRPESLLAAGTLEALLGAPGSEGGDEEAADAGTAQDAPPRRAAAWDMPLPGDGEDDGGDDLWPVRADDDEALPALGEADEAPASGRTGGQRPRDPWRPRPDAAPADRVLDQTLAEADRLLARSRRTLERYNDLGTATGRDMLTIDDPAYGGPERVAAWRAAVAAADGLPAVLVTAAALDAWLLLEPSEHRGEWGFLLSAALLRGGALSLRHLPALALGYRLGRFRWGPHQDHATRLGGLLAAIRESAVAGQADIDRLALARAAMQQRCLGRSRNSRLGQLVDLFLASPIVTVQLAARKLDVTPQAVDAMLRELGPALPRELTGRRRYRAWGIV